MNISKIKHGDIIREKLLHLINSLDDIEIFELYNYSKVKFLNKNLKSSSEFLFSLQESLNRGEPVIIHDFEGNEINAPQILNDIISTSKEKTNPIKNVNNLLNESIRQDLIIQKTKPENLLYSLENNYTESINKAVKGWKKMGLIDENAPDNDDKTKQMGLYYEEMLDLVLHEYDGNKSLQEDMFLPIKYILNKLININNINFRLLYLNLMEKLSDNNKFYYTFNENNECVFSDDLLKYCDDVIEKLNIIEKTNIKEYGVDWYKKQEEIISIYQE